MIKKEVTPDFLGILNDILKSGVHKDTLCRKIGIAHNTLEGYLSEVKPIPNEWNICYRLITLHLQKVVNNDI